MMSQARGTFLIGTRANQSGTPLGSRQPRRRRRPIPKFIAQAIESVKGPEKRKSKSSGREPLNLLPKLKFFTNDFFLAAAGLLILKKFSKVTCRFRASQAFCLLLT